MNRPLTRPNQTQFRNSLQSDRTYRTIHVYGISTQERFKYDHVGRDTSSCDVMEIYRNRGTAPLILTPPHLPTVSGQLYPGTQRGGGDHSPNGFELRTNDCVTTVRTTGCVCVDFIGAACFGISGKLGVWR